MKYFYNHTFLLILMVLIFVSCENDDCKTQCPNVGPNNVVVNQTCDCDCSTGNRVLVSGPVFHYCNLISSNHTYSLRLEEYSNLNCGEISLAFLNVYQQFEPFTGFLPRPYTLEDITEETLVFTLNLAINGEFNSYLNGIRCNAVTQYGGDRSELLIYDRRGTSQANSPEEAKPIYLHGCEDTRKPARAKGYFSDEVVSIHFYFYIDEDTYYNYPDQYLFSEILNFDRQYSRNELEE